jgi:hypothetical protein
MREIFLLTLTIMKDVLDLFSLKFDKKSNEYRIIKKEVMNITYSNLKKFYQKLEKEKIVKRCPNKCDLRQGYDNCFCAGSGYIEFVTDK